MFAEFARFTVKTDMVAVLDGVSGESGVMHHPGSGELATAGLGTEGRCP